MSEEIEHKIDQSLVCPQCGTRHIEVVEKIPIILEDQEGYGGAVEKEYFCWYCEWKGDSL